MHLQLVETIAADGLRLHGGFVAPGNNPNQHLATSCDAVLLVHGAGGNFYASTLLKTVARRVTQWGVAAVLVNTRGHDGISTSGVRDPQSGLFRPQLVGAAFESVDDCLLDLSAWIDWLGQRGCRRIGLIGHSLGAVKSLYAEAHAPHPAVSWVVALSPPRLSYQHFVAGPQAEVFLADLAAAEAHLEAGQPQTLIQVRFPLPYVISAAGFVEKYGRQERYNLLNWIGSVQQPTLVTFGSAELEQGWAFHGLPDALTDRQLNLVRVAVVAGGDHQYTAVPGALLDRVESWLRKTAAGPPAPGTEPV